MNIEQFQNQTAPAAILLQPITAIATSCIVNNPDNFSSLSAGQQFRMAIQDTPNSPIELVLVTATNGTVFTIQRGIENTVPLSHIAGASVAQVATAEHFAAMYPNGGIETIGGPYNFNGSFPIMEINNASPAATAVNILTEYLVPFRPYVIADGAGNAGTYHITLTPDTGLIGGASTAVITTNNGFVRFYWNGTGCRLI